MAGRQHILEFGVEPVYTFANFIEGESNRLALRAVTTLEEGAAATLTLTGGEGCGKTHLLRAAVHHRLARRGPGSAWMLDPAVLERVLAGGGEGELARFVESCAGGTLVALDDLEGLQQGAPAWQEGVLYLFNRLRENGGCLLIASRVSPHHLAWLRPDLRSRLLWGPVLEISPPDDAELEAILTKLAADRQVRLGPELLKFLCLRLPRRIPEHAAALDRLDRAGLERQRPLTVPLAKEILGL
ncbi:MAG: hypothetical protein HQM03_06355 [Magnetococcales bacterium]|nr:hypothetical protein [Magnetococcales bacterium]